MNFILLFNLFLFLSLSSQEIKPLSVKQLYTFHQEGKLSDEQLLLEEFRMVYNPKQSVLNNRDGSPQIFGTPLIRKYIQQRETLSESSLSEIKTYLRSKSSKTEKTYATKNGLFNIIYETEGSLAVRLEDENNNQLPDYIELIESHLETVYKSEVTEAGFDDPFKSGEKYTIRFHNGFQRGKFGNNEHYGATEPETRTITVHHTFENFYENDDKINWQGALKVTLAHEFKHVIQYENSQWKESVMWGELDATWAEEFVYPEINDYVHYTYNYESHIQSPQLTLTSGTGNTGYSNALWFIFLEKQFTRTFFVDLWNYRRSHFNEPFEQSLKTLIKRYGYSLETLLPMYYSWTYFTGERSENIFGFESAQKIPTSEPTKELLLSDNLTFQGNISSFSGNRITFTNLDDPRYISIDLPSELNFAIAGKLKSGKPLYFTNVPQLPYQINQFEHLGIVITNPSIEKLKSQAYVLNIQFNSASPRVSEFIRVQSPVNATLHIDLVTSSHQKAELIVFNILGQQLLSKTIQNSSTEFQLNTSSLAQGIYFLRVQLDDTAPFTKRFVKL